MRYTMRSVNDAFCGFAGAGGRRQVFAAVAVDAQGRQALPGRCVGEKRVRGEGEEEGGVVEERVACGGEAGNAEP